MANLSIPNLILPGQYVDVKIEMTCQYAHIMLDTTWSLCPY